MIRWLVFLLIAAVVAAVAGWIARLPGAVTLDWLGYRIETAPGVLVLAILLAVAVLVGLVRLWSAVTRVPGALVRGNRERRQRRGYESLSRGLVAVAAGDVAGATRQARRAASLLDNRPLTLLLSAQAAQMQGDDAEAARYFKEMRDGPGTEFLGLRGLLTQAMKRQDWPEALKLTEQAYRYNPKSEWVVSTLYDLQKRLGRWRDASETLDQSLRLKLIAPDEAARERAELLCRQSEDDPAERVRWAARAFKADSGYAPAARRYAQVLLLDGLHGRAASTIEHAWEKNPSAELADLYWQARQCNDAVQKLQAAQRLARSNPDHLESRLAVAVAALEAREWGVARTALEPVATEHAPPRVCRLMAELEEAEHGDLARARTWLMRAMADADGPAMSSPIPERTEPAVVTGGTAPTPAPAQA
jgi:HemY protein